jgi:glycosyltransferase involved in cell wall biosynthesis
MNAARVSIVTRTKDRPLLLARSIESVLTQTYGDWLHIIVNDGGDSQTLQRVLSAFASRYRNRLKLIENPQSLGITGALNVGVKAAQSKYVVVHDDDDSWESTFLEKSIATLEAYKAAIPNTRGVICHTVEIREKLTESSVSEVYRYSLNGWIDAIQITQLAAGNFIPPISFLFETDVFSEIGFFKELRFAEDWEFYLRFLSKFEIAVLPKHLANYHVRVGSSNSYGNTLTVSVVNYRAFVTALRNDLVRQDIETGKFGVGHLVAAAESNPFNGYLKHRFWKARHRLFARWNAKSTIRRLDAR